MGSRFYRSQLVTGPSVEPVTVDDVRAHLRMDGIYSDDTYIQNYIIPAARKHVEEYTGRALINQTFILLLDDIPRLHNDSGLGWWDGVREGAITQEQAAWIELDKAPLSSITSFKTYDTTDTATTISTDVYMADTYTEPGRLALRSGQTWPHATRRSNGYEITYVAGYGAAASDVPPTLRQAVLMMAAHFYENRQVTQEDTNPVTPHSAASIMDRYKVMFL